MPNLYFVARATCKHKRVIGVCSDDPKCEPARSEWIKEKRNAGCSLDLVPLSEAQKAGPWTCPCLGRDGA